MASAPSTGDCDQVVRPVALIRVPARRETLSRCIRCLPRAKRASTKMGLFCYLGLRVPTLNRANGRSSMFRCGKSNADPAGSIIVKKKNAGLLEG
jgi:hypothetical protein